MGEHENFDVFRYLESQRLDARQQSGDLLWENIEGSLWWNKYSNFKNDDKDKERVLIQLHQYHPVLCEFRSSFADTVMKISNKDVREILLYGASRRLLSIYRAINDIADISYPDRTELATKEEKARLDDALLILYVHMMGFFDALAIAFYRAKPRLNSDFCNKESLFDPKFRNMLKLPNVHTVIGKNSDWIDRVKNNLRHRFVHRVPPTVPPAVLFPQDQEEQAKLQEEYSQALRNKEFDKLSGIMDKQDSLGEFVDRISFTEINATMPLLSTCLDDVLRFQYIALTIFEELVPFLELQDP